ncbi:hypothetical protein L7E55_06060 [Pelotomaculum isophthalicicum JI]|uniref:Uncharacterized protein n=1 Tax=Pelotomaculum isophthalicicum JI TaxID=947010 RepID=A0A9X4GYL9_9FIRM|nr:hypothetical protein [Pelotomaculum isophthalicicum]MDF9407927.1 hypothetical protein [Pelotomaculum isophthalicicum JI]
MQLSPGERSILSYFSSDNQAQKAVNALRNAGMKEVRLDRVSRYGEELNREFNNPVNNALSLTGLTLFSSGDSENLNDNGRILLGADPSSSGYGCADYGVAGGRAFLVTVVTSDKHVNKAVEIIKQKGGEV